jgi:hypothetical protein
MSLIPGQRFARGFGRKSASARSNRGPRGLFVPSSGSSLDRELAGAAADICPARGHGQRRLLFGRRSIVVGAGVRCDRAASLQPDRAAPLTSQVYLAKTGQVSPAKAPPEGPIDPRGSRDAERSWDRRVRSRVPDSAGTLGRRCMRPCRPRSTFRKPLVASKNPMPMR